MVHPTLIKIQKTVVTILNEIEENTKYEDVYEYFIELDSLIDEFDNFLGAYYENICTELNNVDYYMEDVRPYILELLYKVNDLIVNYKYWI